MPERREEKRISVAERIDVINENYNEKIGTLVDISPKGLRINGPEEMPLDEDMHLCLRLPTQILGKRTIRVVAVSVWSKREPEQENWQSGFEFYRVSEHDSSLIIGLILEIQKT